VAVWCLVAFFVLAYAVSWTDDFFHGHAYTGLIESHEEKQADAASN
jgi:hypothetical protein